MRRRVVEQIPDHPYELICVDVVLRSGYLRRVHVQCRMCTHAAGFGEHDLVQVHWFSVGGVERRSVGDCNGEKIFDESLKTNGVGQQLSCGLLSAVIGLAFEFELQLRAHAGERATELMARVCDEAALSLLRILQTGSIAFMVWASRPTSSW